MTEIDDEKLQLLVDKQEIRDVIMRCARGSDRFDMELFRGAFHPDATMAYEGLFQGDAEYVFKRVEEFQSTLDGTMHVISNHLSEVQGNVAYAETYVNAYHWATPRDDVTRNFFTGTRYVDKFERRDGEWKIIRRITLRNFVRHDPGLRTPPPVEGRLRGTRDRDDPSYLRD